MHIPGEYFKENVFDKVKDAGGIDPWAAAKITKDCFCSRMFSTKLCPKDCKMCLRELRTQLDFSKSKPRSVKGAYTYRLKDAVGRKEDERQEQRAKAPLQEISADDPLGQIFTTLVKKMDGSVLKE